MMVKLRAIDLVVQIFIFQMRICCSQSTLKFRLNEESSIGTFVGNVREYVSSNFQTNGQYKITLMDDYFSIRSNKELVVKKQIDLEKLCTDSNKCCEVAQCLLKLSAKIDPDNHRFDIEIEIADINDNEPYFKDTQQTLLIPENSKIGQTFNMDGGLDEDKSRINQIQRYKFEELTKTFDISTDDLTSFSIVLQKAVDYENKRVYNARLAACDSDSRCKYQNIVINIEDENDNSPIFEKKQYSTTISESFEVGKIVLHTRAKDLDGPKFNKTVYDIINNQNSNKFKINSLTGDIVLLKKLSASQGQSYSFKIAAKDAAMSSKRDLADVIITVLDINDNAPRIEVFKNDETKEYKEMFEMTVPENEKAQKLVSMKVSDADLGLNSKVDCRLIGGSSSLQLKYFEPELYEISSVRSFDYEQETHITATFECNDSGIPSFTSRKSIKINIEDVNEFPPEFLQSDYHANVRENCEPGEIVLTVTATDKDGSANLTYSIEESANLYFVINPTTGVITTASLSFDREQIFSKSVQVTVTDATNQPKSADTSVVIRILDENDNNPIFVPSSLHFFISENQPSYSKLQGQLAANDADKDELNSQVSFYLIAIFDHELRVCGRPFFRIKTNGEAETSLVIDRETNANFTLTVEARDSGNPQRHSRANVTVTVRDVNDNSPQWIYPRMSEIRKNNANSIAMINLTDSMEIFSLIMKLKAFDPDESDAGRVSYTLLHHHESLFTVNETTGELRTERSPLPYGQYQLQFRASDHGNPLREADSWIVVNVLENGKFANINLTIIIVMVAITALISIFLIVAIICVRRRPRFHQSYLEPHNETIKDQSSQHFSNSQWMYHPSDNNTMTHLAEDESYIYLPASYYESQDPFILQSGTGSRPGSRLEYPMVLPSSLGNNSDLKYAVKSLQNVERSNGTLRSMNGQYCSINAPSSGIIINGQELDGDSADSGKGASEVDLRLQNHLNGVSRNYPTMPFPHHSTSTSTFGYQTNLPGQQYYSVNTNPKSYDSRFLTMHPSNQSGNRRIMSPTFNSNKQCQCFILPEDDVIQIGHDGNQLPMTTFSQQSMCNFKTSAHDQSCIYRDDALSSSGAAYYPNYPYIQGSTGRVSVSPIQFSYNDADVQARGDDKLEIYNVMYETQKPNIYSSSEQLNQENNSYKLGLANS